MISVNSKNSTILFFIAFMFLCKVAYLQDIEKKDRPLYKKAMASFENEDFQIARAFFLDLLKTYPENIEINYYIGACYLNTRYKKENAIPYLTKAIEEGEDIIPSIVHKDLGDLHHSFYNFDSAIYHYKMFFNLAERDDEYIDYCSRMIEICNNAKEIVSDTLNLNISRMDDIINTSNSEYAPYVSADDSILFFTRKNFYTDELLAELSFPDTLKKIFTTVSQNKQWDTPKEIIIKSKEEISNVSIAGMSPDGEYLFINALNNKNQDIFGGKYTGGEVLEVSKLPKPINSEYWEGNITISPDGNSLWFASNRPGGYGGIDLYKATKLENGEWNEPENLGSNVNTEFDENTPFIHPSGEIFYFSSNGHNTMGGSDIFSVLLNKNDLLFPVNMGFPINTTSDDSHFALSANGKTGYFASAYGNKYNTYDLYKIKMNLNIPLTLVKGYISVGSDDRHEEIKIRVVDNETGIKQRYIYNPNPVTGRYLMIFPPGKNYNMIVEAEGYIPKSISIYIPDQEGFYELYQNISLKPVLSSGKKIGEELKVENIFHETENDSVNKKDYSKLFDAIDSIIEGTDSLEQEKIETKGFEVSFIDKNIEQENYETLFEKIDLAFEMGNKEVLNKIHENTIIPDRFNQVFFFSDNNTEKYLEKIRIGDDSVIITPQLKAYNDRPRIELQPNDLIHREIITIDTVNNMIITEKENEINISPIMLRRSDPSKRKVILKHKIFFDKNQQTPNKSYKNEIEEVAKLLINNDQLGAVLTGYADSQGSISNNKILSQMRAISILEKLYENGANLNKVIVVAKGEEDIIKEKSAQDMAFNRRVEITVFELVIDKNE